MRIYRDSDRDSVCGRRAGSHIIRLLRLLGEGPMGKPVANPPKKGRLPANGEPSGHRLTPHTTKVANAEVFRVRYYN